MKKLLAILTIATLLSTVFASSAHAAGPASFSLSPASGTHTQGNNFTVQVYENGTEVNAVTAKLAFDATKLSCVSIGVSTAFPSTIVASCGNGTATISRYTAMDGEGNPTTVSGNQQVGSVTFKALAETGTAAVTFAAGSQIASNGTNIWNGSVAGGTYSFTAAPTTTPTNPAPTTPTATTPTTTAPTNTTRTTTNGGTTSTQTSQVAGEQTAAAEAVSPVVTTDAPAPTEDTSSVQSDKTSNNVWLWVLAILALIAAGTFAARKFLPVKAFAPVVNKPAKGKVAAAAIAKKSIKSTKKPKARSKKTTK